MNSELQKAILGVLKSTWSRCNPNPYTFSKYEFGEIITLKGILCDQHDIGWNDFNVGRWSPKQREAQ